MLCTKYEFYFLRYCIILNVSFITFYHLTRDARVVEIRSKREKQYGCTSCKELPRHFQSLCEGHTLWYKNMQHNPHPSFFTSLFETISIISHEDFNREFQYSVQLLMQIVRKKWPSLLSRHGCSTMRWIGHTCSSTKEKMQSKNGRVLKGVDSTYVCQIVSPMRYRSLFSQKLSPG